MRQRLHTILRRRSGAHTGVLALALLLAACDSGMEGSFQDELGVSRYTFDSDGVVAISVMGTTVRGKYEMDGEEIIVIGPHGQLALRRDGENLTGPMGLVLTPVRGE